MCLESNRAAQWLTLIGDGVRVNLYRQAKQAGTSMRELAGNLIFDTFYRFG